MQGKVSVGLSTVTGYGVTVIGFATAVVAYLTGDHSQQTVGVIAAGGVAALAFAITQIGRYLQAKAIIQQEQVPGPPGPPGVMGPTGATGPQGVSGTASASAGYVTSGSNAGPVMEGPGDPLPGELEDIPAPAWDPVDTGDGEAAPA